MLNIWFGKMPDVIYNTSVFFKNTYVPRWIIFEAYLVQHTAGTHYAYSKSHLHHFYTVRENRGKIVALIAAHLPKG